MNYTLLTDVDEDENGLWYSFLCPQAYDYIETKFKTIKVPMVSMRKFRLSHFPLSLLPLGCKLPSDLLATELLAICDGLQRFADRIGLEPVEVRTKRFWVDQFNDCLNRNNDGGTGIYNGWYNAVLNSKWSGVTFGLERYGEIRRLLGY